MQRRGPSTRCSVLVVMSLDERINDTRTHHTRTYTSYNYYVLIQQLMYAFVNVR